MPAGVYNIKIEQGVPFTFSVEYKAGNGSAKDLTGYLGRGAIKTKMSDTANLADFTVEITEPLEGKIKVSLPASALQNKVFPGITHNDYTEGVYDIELYKNETEIIRLLNGTVLISPEVTK